MTRTNLGTDTLDSICFDEQELLSQRARLAWELREDRVAQGQTPFVRRPVCPGHVVEGDGETAKGFRDSLGECANEGLVSDS